MAKRRFDGKRAYRLSSIIIIIISLLFGLFGLLQLKSVSSGEYSLDKIEQECSGSGAELMCQTYYLTNGDYSLDSLSKADRLCSGTGAGVGCKSYYILERGDLQDSGWRNLGIATVLLVIFLGGTWLYRYLFPVQKTETDGS